MLVVPAKKLCTVAGFVTTTRVTHATPAAAYAFCSNRRWECEAKIPETDSKNCKDIGRQLIEDENGKQFNVYYFITCLYCLQLLL